jgi:tRNA pseudouridine38-40 synthase
MPRRNFLVTLAFDGTDFLGWQRLPGKGRSVQGEVESALGRVLGEPIEITGAGRTDAGVHAEGQAASFHSRTSLSCDDIKRGLNRELPGDAACRSCREVDPRFHARFRVKRKLYRYRLHVAPDPDPFCRRYSLHVAEALDVEAMRAAGRAMIGERDFRSLTNAKEGDSSRRVDEVRVEAAGAFLDLIFAGPGFLTNQVRIMAAVLLEAGRGGLGPDEVRSMLDSRDRAKAPGMLGAFGLCLVEVRY